MSWLPRWLAQVTPSARVPAAAVLLVGFIAIVLALSGTFDLLTDMVVFVLLLFNGLAVAAVYVLRRNLPDAVRPYRVWGYPVVPALFAFGNPLPDDKHGCSHAGACARRTGNHRARVSRLCVSYQAIAG